MSLPRRNCLPRYAALSVTVAAALACGGKDRGTGDTSAAAPAGTSASTAPGAAGGAATAQAATGTTVEVKMLGDAQGYRFEPANVTIKVGDAVRWTNVSGGPHNVTFWPDSIPAGADAQLGANMPNTTGPLTGPLLTDPNATYTVSFAGGKPGVYKYYCTPHLALGMKAQITVQ